MTRSVGRAGAWRPSAALVVVGLAAARRPGPGGPVPRDRRRPGPRGGLGLRLRPPRSATGTATHRGKYSGDGVFDSLRSTRPPAAAFHGTFTFVAKDGDRLACTCTGRRRQRGRRGGAYQAYPTPDGRVTSVFVAKFNRCPSECTGRFKNVVDGSFLMIAVSEPFDLVLDANGFTPPVHYDWDGTGWLEVQAGQVSRGGLAPDSRWRRCDGRLTDLRRPPPAAAAPPQFTAGGDVINPPPWSAGPGRANRQAARTPSFAMTRPNWIRRLLATRTPGRPASRVPPVVPGDSTSNRSRAGWCRARSTRVPLSARSDKGAGSVSAQVSSSGSVFKSRRQ